MRILVLIAIGLLLYIIISNHLRKLDKAKADASKTEQLVQCEHCGLHILQNEAVEHESHFYCSQEHVEADSQAKK